MPRASVKLKKIKRNIDYLLTIIRNRSIISPGVFIYPSLLLLLLCKPNIMRKE